MKKRDYAQEAVDWLRFLGQAKALSEEDLKRHASVSIRNHCGCGQCFCCACKQVLKAKYSQFDGEANAKSL